MQWQLLRSDSSPSFHVFAVFDWMISRGMVHVLVVMLMRALWGLSIAVTGNTVWLRRKMVLRLRALGIVWSGRSVSLHWRHYVDLSSRAE